MLFQYIGDPRHGGEGPETTTIAGFKFVLNGPPVDFVAKEKDNQLRKAEIADWQRRLSDNSHFRIVTKEMILEDAKKKAKAAAKAAKEAEALAASMASTAEAELAALAARAEDDAEVPEDAGDDAGDDNGTDESATEDPGASTSRGPRRFRRG